jgi:FixJ family two-component response regulator
MNLNPPTVFAVDDDALVRRALERLLRSAGLAVRTFASAQEFLDQALDEPGCLVLDVSMPKLSGLGLQAALAARGMRIPIVFLTGHADIPMSVQAMKGGAADFLTKPFRPKDLLAAVHAALDRDRKLREEQAELESLRGRVASLTPRELEVFRCVVAGSLNQQIAAQLHISERTVKVHRGRVMRKLQALSVAGLTRLAERLALDIP